MEEGSLLPGDISSSVLFDFLVESDQGKSVSLVESFDTSGREKIAAEVAILSRLLLSKKEVWRMDHLSSLRWSQPSGAERCGL